MHKFEISIAAKSQEEAAEKLRCATTFIKKFSLAELQRLAEVVEKEPAKVAFAKKALGL